MILEVVAVALEPVVGVGSVYLHDRPQNAARPNATLRLIGDMNRTDLCGDQRLAIAAVRVEIRAESSVEAHTLAAAARDAVLAMDGPMQMQSLGAVPVPSRPMFDVQAVHRESGRVMPEDNTGAVVAQDDYRVDYHAI